AYYAFRGEAGDVVGVSVQLTESGTLPDLALETEAGTPIRTPVITTDNETYIPAFALPADGRYVIKLDSHATVGYELSAFTRKADTPENALVRSLGENRTFAEGVLDPARPTYWQFPGEVGDVLTFTIDTRGGGLRADATLYGPDGYITNAVEYPGPDMTLGPVRLPATGDYLLIVGPWLGEMGGSTGQYSLLAATAEAGVSGSAGGHIAVWDQRVVGGFIVGDTQDVWTFDGRADDMITIQAEQTFGEGSFNLTLAGPDNLELIASEPATSYLGSEIVGFTLPVDGVYTVTVNSRLAGESSVEYTLVVSLEPRIPDGTVALSMTPVNTLTLPMAVAQHGQITLEQPVQSWLIYPTYTGTYVIDVASLVVGANLDVFVLQTDSVPLTNSDQHTRISASLAAEVGYVVQVSGGPTMERGRYTLEVMPAITLTYGAPITVGASNVGRIDDTAQHNEWRVQGQVNTAWIIEVTPITGNLIPNVTIAGPTGDVFQQTISDIHDPLSVTFQVPADGSYAVEISGVGFTTGDYVINLREG
ncbi:MAG: PPC domain-containing protein, partial [Anaerolineae bacterium]|nr:PPC domain-containing protein [Anaerolineae bacterium]